MAFSTTALAIYATVASVAAAGISAYGQMQQGKAANAAAQAQADMQTYNAAVARNNQIIAKRAADDARLRGEHQAIKVKQAADQLRGRQLAAFAGAGVDVDSDTAIDVMAETAEIGKIDELTVKANAAREAMGFEQEAMGFERDAVLGIASAGANRSAGAFAQSSANLAAAGSLAGGLASVSGKWYNYSKT